MRRDAGLTTLGWRLFRLRAVRFAIVGGLGIPINMSFLWLFYSLIGFPMKPAWVLAFIGSAFINFYANQRFTYHEQKHLKGWDWLIRAAKAQMSSLSGLVVNICVFTLLMDLGLHYLPADAIGIASAFSVNFLVSKRFVFTPALCELEPIAEPLPEARSLPDARGAA